MHLLKRVQCRFSVAGAQTQNSFVFLPWNSFASVPVSIPSSGLPKPVIRWLRNGQELTGNEPGVSILEDGTLLILASVSPMDNGEYVCTAANDAGSTERKYQLKVNGD